MGGSKDSTERWRENNLHFLAQTLAPPVELDLSIRRLLKTKRWYLGKGLNNQLIT
jgi:hypothetical protein